MKSTIEVRLLSASIVADDRAVLTFASQRLTIRSEVQADRWDVRLVVAKLDLDQGGWTGGDGLIVRQDVKTEDLAKALGTTSTNDSWSGAERAALSLFRSALATC